MVVHRNKGEWIFIQCIISKEITSLLLDVYLNGAYRPIQVYFWDWYQPLRKQLIRQLSDYRKQ